MKYSYCTFFSRCKAWFCCFFEGLKGNAFATITSIIHSRLLICPSLFEGLLPDQLQDWCFQAMTAIQAGAGPATIVMPVLCSSRAWAKLIFHFRIIQLFSFFIEQIQRSITLDQFLRRLLTTLSGYSWSSLTFCTGNHFRIVRGTYIMCSRRKQ